jgi:hypothetical protein
MNKETIVNYSFTILEEYKNLEDRSPNFHYVPAIKVKNTGTVLEFLESLKSNSKTPGLSIGNIDFEVLTNKFS